MKYLLAIINAFGLFFYLAGVVIYTYWVCLAGIEYSRGNKLPDDWGFTFLFALELLIAGGFIVAFVSFITYAKSIQFPFPWRQKLIYKIIIFGAFFFVLLFLAHYIILYSYRHK